MPIPKTTHGTYLHPGTPEYTAAILKIQAAARGKDTTKEKS